VLEALFGNQNVERILFYLLNNDEAYPSALAAAFSVSLSPIQKQLQRLEAGGVVASRLVGRTRVYQIDPRYAFKTDLEALLAKAFKALPDSQVRGIYARRSRPRRPGKP
jgi:predicted transcriptional regulator